MLAHSQSKTSEDAEGCDCEISEEEEGRLNHSVGFIISRMKKLLT